MTITEIKALIHDLVDTNTSDFADARMVRGLNKAQDKVVNIMLQNEYLYQYDDENYTDLNEGFLNIVSGQNDYDVREDENFANLLFISKIFIKDATTGLYSELKKTGITMDTTSAPATTFRLTGKTIILSPIPNANITNGLKVNFARVPTSITTADTTKEVSMPQTFHYILALYTAYDFARAKRMDNRNDLLSEIQTEEQRLGLFIQSKDKGVNNGMKPFAENNK